MNEEYCPHCDGYTDFSMDDIDEYGKITCQHCGEKIHACSVCDLLADKSWCDFNEKTGCCSFYNRTWAERLGIN